MTEDESKKKYLLDWYKENIGVDYTELLAETDFERKLASMNDYCGEQYRIRRAELDRVWLLICASWGCPFPEGTSDVLRKFVQELDDGRSGYILRIELAMRLIECRTTSRNAVTFFHDDRELIKVMRDGLAVERDDNEPDAATLDLQDEKLREAAEEFDAALADYSAYVGRWMCSGVV